MLRIKQVLPDKTSLFFAFGLLPGLLPGSLTNAVAQTTYYVANSGNDGNNGRSASSAFQSLNKVNSLPLQAGDQVLFQRG